MIFLLGVRITVVQITVVLFVQITFVTVSSCHQCRIIATRVESICIYSLFIFLQELETRTTREVSGVGNKQDNEAVETDRYVGKLDLKQWSSEVEGNKLVYTKSTEPIHSRNEDKTRYNKPKHSSR